MLDHEFKCEECGATFRTWRDREAHNREVHSRFTCDICGETFTSEREFQAHTSVAHPEIRQPGTR